MHDWDDEQCIKIFKNCYEALPHDGKLLTVDVVMEKKEGMKRQVGLLLDIAMMAACIGGKERTQEEFKDLFEQAGFKSYKIFELPFPQTLIEVSK